MQYHVSLFQLDNDKLEFGYTASGRSDLRTRDLKPLRKCRRTRIQITVVEADVQYCNLI